MPAYSGLFDGHYGTPHALLTNTTGNEFEQLAKVMGKRPYGRAKLRAITSALLGAAVGGAATATHKRVSHTVSPEAPANGGLRVIETYTAVNRVTTADDLAKLEEAIAQSAQPSSYPADLSGNGGGGKITEYV